MDEQRARRISIGRCSTCNTTLSKRAMTGHLKSCIAREAATIRTSRRSRAKTTKVFHLVVEGGFPPEYWMHLEAQADAKLLALDYFLRDVWLECCEHLSAFTIQGTMYQSDEEEFMEVESMDVPLGEVIHPGMKFVHEYDFGTTTQLALKCVTEREGERWPKGVRLLARNDPPLLLCVSCGKSAVQVCSNCTFSAEAWLCDDCAEEHECGEEMLLPVVNSPRVGMCGYTG